MKKYLLFLSLFIVGLFIAGCATQVPEALGLPGANCTTSKDCQQNLVCLNNTCRISPACREQNQACSANSDCCNGLTCSNYKCVSSGTPTPIPSPGESTNIRERESASYWSSADIGIVRYYLSSEATTSQLVLRNNRLFQVNVTSIFFDGSSVFSTSTLLAPGSSTAVNLTTAACSTPGQNVSHNVIIMYKDATYGVQYTFSGEKPLVGTCQ